MKNSIMMNNTMLVGILHFLNSTIHYALHAYHEENQMCVCVCMHVQWRYHGGGGGGGGAQGGVRPPKPPVWPGRGAGAMLLSTRPQLAS